MEAFVVFCRFHALVRDVRDEWIAACLEAAP
jgi:hypothetical protein